MSTDNEITFEGQPVTIDYEGYPLTGPKADAIYQMGVEARQARAECEAAWDQLSDADKQDVLDMDEILKLIHFDQWLIRYEEANVSTETEQS